MAIAGLMNVVMISDEKLVTKALRKELNDLKKKAEKELVYWHIDN